MKKYEFDDIRTQVNRLDEKYGCILTDSKYFSDPEFEFHNAANDMPTRVITPIWIRPQ